MRAPHLPGQAEMWRARALFPCPSLCAKPSVSVRSARYTRCSLSWRETVARTARTTLRKSGVTVPPPFSAPSLFSLRENSGTFSPPHASMLHTPCQSSASQRLHTLGKCVNVCVCWGHMQVMAPLGVRQEAVLRQQGAPCACARCREEGRVVSVLRQQGACQDIGAVVGCMLGAAPGAGGREGPVLACKSHAERKGPWNRGHGHHKCCTPAPCACSHRHTSSSIALPAVQDKNLQQLVADIHEACVDQVWSRRSWVSMHCTCQRPPPSGTSKPAIMLLSRLARSRDASWLSVSSSTPPSRVQVREDLADAIADGDTEVRSPIPPFSALCLIMCPISCYRKIWGLARKCSD